MIDRKIYMRKKQMLVFFNRRLHAHCESWRIISFWIRLSIEMKQRAISLVSLQPFPPSSAICHLSGTPVHREFSST